MTVPLVTSTRRDTVVANTVRISTDSTALAIMILYGIAVLMTFTVYAAFAHLLFLPFSPGYAAFTFPMAIGVTAQFKVADQVEAWGARASVVQEIRMLGWIEMALASLVITYVAIRFAIFLIQKPNSPAIK